ncbi:MAG TPA: hypothetical protein VLW50_07585 [Streptosporangiaceae bacterium]|nr:hypothetical protein [Streptosporangiaceae bacterium]
MRTYYEIEESDAYLGARDLLLRRVEAWAGANGLVMSLPLAGALLDSRHFSSDGRLGFWTPAQVRRALLEWIPEKVTAPEGDLLDAPETLRSLLCYLDAHGLRDPRGAAAEENESAIDAAAREFADAIGDQQRYGMAKTVAMAAQAQGVDIGDPVVLAGFLNDVQAGRVVLDEGLLGRVLERRFGRPSPAQERKFAQLPVKLPAPEELTAAAGCSKVSGQLRALADWLGPKGRMLTAAGNVRPADARELISLLGTGDKGLAFRSAPDLPGLDLIVNWAKKARLVRRQGPRLVPVAKARPVLADADALWQRAFEAAFDLGDAACRPLWADEPPSPLRLLYDVIVPDVMATIYSMEEPVPVARLAESVWDSVRAHFEVDSLSPVTQIGQRVRVDNDLEHIFDVFEALGAVASVHDLASGVFSEDLDEAVTMPSGTVPFTGERAAALRERLAAPGRLVSLAPLGTRAMRQRMLAEGREAGLVGELANASPAELLGTVAQHYTPATAAEEIAIWRATRGRSLDPLIRAIRDCPFLCRKAAMLNVLASGIPEGDELLASLLRDPELGPVALLVQKRDRDPDEASPEEAAWLMAGSILELLEIGGPDAVRAQLEELPRRQRVDVVRAVCDSGYPARGTLEDFRVLVAEPILSAPPRLRAARNASARDPRRPKRRGR